MIKLIITLLFLVTSAFSAQVNSNQDNLVFAHHLNENSGTVINATVGSVTAGTTNGAWVNGVFGSGIYHTGNANYSTAGNYDDVIDNIVVNVWVSNLGSLGTFDYIAQRMYSISGNNRGWRIYNYNGDALGETYWCAAIGNGAVLTIINTKPIRTGIFPLVSIWFKGLASGGTGKAIIFVNGKQITNVDYYGTAIQQMGATTNNVEIGRNINNGTITYGKEIVDDLSIIKNVTTLTQAQAIIKQIYTNGRGQND
jgi:hypothetical protein